LDQDKESTVAIEHIAVSDVSAKDGAKGTYYKIGKLFCFEPKVAADLLPLMGKTVAVDVDRTPNAEGKVFAKILSFHGEVAAGAAPPPAPAVSSTQPATPAAPAGAPQPAAGGGDFKKDPVGIILGSRQTALNAAVAYADKFEAGSIDVIKTAQTFNEFLLAGLSPFILRYGIHAKHAMPWREDLRAAENEAARAALPPPPPPPAEPTPSRNPDDDIPF
jgi:hypothetical protein